MAQGEREAGMKKTVYIETSIVSYLTARLSNNLIIAANQQITQEWWETQHIHYRLFASELVIREASAGDTEAVARRLRVLNDLQLLQFNPLALALAKQFVQKKLVPEKAMEDALHVALATVSGMDYLLTWNCKYIANASIRHRIEQFCYAQAYEPPVICTPQELIGE
jgi:hypothetical protein